MRPQGASSDKWNGSLPIFKEFQDRSREKKTNQTITSCSAFDHANTNRLEPATATDGDLIPDQRGSQTGGC